MAPAGDRARKVRVEGAELLTFNSNGKLTDLEPLTNDLPVVARLTAEWSARGRGRAPSTISDRSLPTHTPKGFLLGLERMR
jgi:hypothetical protein